MALLHPGAGYADLSADIAELHVSRLAPASTAAAFKASYVHLNSLISICRHFAVTLQDWTESGGVARELSGRGFPSDVQDIWAKVASRLSYLGLPHTDSIPGASTVIPGT